MFLQVSQWNHQRNANSNALVINDFSIVDYLLFFDGIMDEIKKSRGIFSANQKFQFDFTDEITDIIF
jgi:hypothetical protein